jgi:hypothetical protein
MALTDAQLDTIATAVRQARATGEMGEALVRSVRAACPGLSITGTLASLMVERPYRRDDGFNLFLVDSSGHCWSLTRDPEDATGVLLAIHDDDDEEDNS